VLAIYINIENLSELYDGDGIELFYCIVNTFVYFTMLLLGAQFNNKTKPSKGLSLVVFVSLIFYTATNLSEFFLYFTTFLANRQAFLSTVIGSLFGLGICISFTALFTLFLKGFVAPNKQIKQVVWSFFLAGFISQNVVLLQQIGWLTSGGILWDSSNIVADASQYGYLLNTLVGYISAPTIEHVVMYFASLAISTAIYLTSTQTALSKPVSLLSRSKK
jgi:high-affinity iron transporter